MYSFRNDYSEGAHPRVLQALVDTNLTQTCGYGVDPICDEARALIRTLCAAPDAAVHFLVGGNPDEHDGHHGAAGLLRGSDRRPHRPCQLP